MTAWKAIHLAAVPAYLLVAVTLGALAHAGCAPPPAVFNSRTDLASAAQIERLIVMTDLGIDDRVYLGFEEGLAHRLAECGVKTRMVRIARGDPDARERVLRDLHDFEPTAAMMIDAEGGTIVFEQSDPKVTHGRLVFRFDLLDVATQRATWVAKSVFPVETNNSWIDAVQGVRFATSVASRLRDDGVLQGCPPSDAGWPEIKPVPGCREERRKALAKAMQLTTAERARMIQFAPVCE